MAAYCRVSTDREDQSSSLESQKKYFLEYISRNPLWQLAEVYVDQGITGTSTKKRKEFNRMISDAQNKKFDMIITKEISRFARNTLDSIYYTRKLKELGVGVIFMSDNINTLDRDSELRLTIMSSIAQEESRKTSERVKWGQKRRMEQGIVFGRDMLGYDVRDGKLTINESGAETVRLIFHKFINEGKGSHTIARELRETGVETATYMKQWSNTVILRVLRNEKYCGDLIQKKTYTPSYLNHEKKYNNGQEDFVVIRNHHEPIISTELFEKAQKELKKRSPSKEEKSKYSNRYCLSGKIKCGLCGNTYVSRTKKNNGELVYKGWRCFEYAKNGCVHIDEQGNAVGCDNKSVNEKDLKLILQYTIKNIITNKEKVIDELYDSIKRAIANSTDDKYLKQLENKINNVSKKRQLLIDMYLNKEISKTDFNTLIAKYEMELENEKKELSQLKEHGFLYSRQDMLLQKIRDKSILLSCGKEWDDAFYRNIIDKIIVHENKEIEIKLNMIPDDLNGFIMNIKDLKCELKNAYND